MFDNTANAVQTTNEALDNGTLDLNYSLAYGLGNSSFNSSIGSDSAPSSTETNEKLYSGRSTPNWRDYYNPWDKEVTLEKVASSIAADGIDAVANQLNVKAPELMKSVEFASKVNGGDDIVDAAISTYGDALTAALPDGYSEVTEAALRIGAGEDRVSVLGDVYGQDIGLDNPLGKASVESLNTYDQTGDTNKAIIDGLVTYIEEGGTLPEFEVPDYMKTELDFDLPDVDFGGISFADLPDFNLPDAIDLGINIGSIDFSGVSVPDLNIDLGELPQLAGDIDLPSLDWSGVDVTLPEVNLPQLGELGVDIAELDWSGTNIGNLDGIDLPNLDFGDLEGLAKGTTTIASVGVDKELFQGDSDLFADGPEINRLSQKLLNAKLV